MVPDSVYKDNIVNLRHLEWHLSLSPVNKYIILNANPPPIVHTTVCAASNTTHQHENTSCKVKLSPYFIKHHTMRVHRDAEVQNLQLHTFLTPALDREK